MDAYEEKTVMESADEIERLYEERATLRAELKALREAGARPNEHDEDGESLDPEISLSKVREHLERLDRYDPEYVEPYGYASPTGRFLDRDDVLEALAAFPAQPIETEDSEEEE
jgi:hypothetical protein